MKECTCHSKMVLVMWKYPHSFWGIIHEPFSKMQFYESLLVRYTSAVMQREVHCIQNDCCCGFLLKTDIHANLKNFWCSFCWNTLKAVISPFQIFQKNFDLYPDSLISFLLSDFSATLQTPVAQISADCGTHPCV